MARLGGNGRPLEPDALLPRLRPASYPSGTAPALVPTHSMSALLVLSRCYDATRTSLTSTARAPRPSSLCTIGEAIAPGPP
eukprot:647351-Rhodomonas_salina.4